MKDEHIIARLNRTPLTGIKPEELDDMRAHAEKCDKCREVLESAIVASSLLEKLAAREVEPSPFFHAGVMARLRYAGVERPMVLRLKNLGNILIDFTSYGHFRWKYATLAASLLVMAVTYTVWFSSPDRNSTTPAPAVVGAEIPTPQEAFWAETAMILDEAPDIAGEEADDRVATDFIPLTFSADPLLFEGGQVIRVTMPRSALPGLGVPVNLERFGEEVDADVIIGDDGMARAIRFLQ